jgi:hypothetical protein
MSRFKNWLAIGVCTALIGFGVATTANAQSMGGTHEQGLIKLTEPLDVGGTILPPGDYNIIVVSGRIDRNMLQVWNAEGTELLTTLLSVPHREGPSGVQVPENRYIYYPASDDSPRALRTWFASNTPNSGGHDIVYSKARAMELAARVEEPVVAIPDEVQVAELETVPLVVVTPEKKVVPYKPPTIEEPPAKLAQKAPPQRLLPQTASNVPLIAGLGFLSLVGALGLGVLARRFV